MVNLIYFEGQAGAKLFINIRIFMYCYTIYRDSLQSIQYNNNCAGQNVPHIIPDFIKKCGTSYVNEMDGLRKIK
ncbi:hypothetical protein CHS0354_040925, partial [Potamilus streckersoni]